MEKTQPPTPYHDRYAPSEWPGLLHSPRRHLESHPKRRTHDWIAAVSDAVDKMLVADMPYLDASVLMHQFNQKRPPDSGFPPFCGCANLVWDRSRGPFCQGSDAPLPSGYDFTSLAGIISRGEGHCRAFGID